MNSEMNDMEQWMQQSAEIGNVPVKEADWQQMKQLLQPEKKRRFIFLWWLIGLLLVGSVLWFTRLNNANKNQSSNNVIINNKTKKTNETYKEEPSSIKNGNEKTMQKEEINKTDLLTQTTKEKKDLEKKTQNRALNKESRQMDRSNTKSAVIIDSNDKDSYTTNKKQPEQEDNNERENKSIAVVTTDAAEQQTLTTTTISTMEPQRQEPGKVQADTASVNEKLANGNIILPPPGDSSAIKKKKTNKRSEWLLAAGYYTGTIPVKSNGVIAKITYSHSLKRFTINPSIAIHQFAPDEQQQYNGITKITQNPGTTFIMLNTQTVNFSPAKGIVLAPALAVGYSFNKLNLTIGANKGFVINGNNITTSTVDTFSFSTAPLPATIKVTSPYNAANFNGKQYTAVDLGLRYNLTKKLHLGINFAKQLNNNKMEGIINEKKKRAALFFFFGLKL